MENGAHNLCHSSPSHPCNLAFVQEYYATKYAKIWKKLSYDLFFALLLRMWFVGCTIPSTMDGAIISIKYLWLVGQ
jgi:hypothetical protein